MDTFTHMALGACIGQAIGYKKIGGRAMFYGALAGLIPDLDVLSGPFLGEYATWKYHRHITHALWFVILFGGFLGWGLWRHYGRQREHLKAWLSVMSLSMLSHPLLDNATIYGTQLLAPFSSRRFELPAISIIDPLYTIPLCIALLIMLAKRVRQYARPIALTVLFLTTGYLLSGLYLNHRAEQLAKDQLARQNIPVRQVEAFTTIFQPFLRRVLVQDGDGGWRAGFVSTFDPHEIKWTCRADAPDHVKEAIMKTDDARIFDWFSGGHLGFVQATTDPALYHVTDMRYGIPGESVFGWWGQTYRLKQVDGNLVADYLGKYMIERDASWHNIKQLFRAAYGLENEFLPKQDIGCSQ